MVRTSSTTSITGLNAGRPDYSAEVAPGKSKIADDQVAWELLVTRRNVDANGIAAGSSSTVTAYTVPTGYQLHMGGGVITCNASCIQKVVMTHTPGVIGDFMYDVRGQIQLGPHSSVILDAGDVLTIYIYNNDTVERDFSISLQGWLEKVE